jgi:hypothetical protein
MRIACVQDVAYLTADFLATSNQEASELLMIALEMADTARLVNKAGPHFQSTTYSTRWVFPRKRKSYN